MAINIVKEKWTSKINELVLGKEPNTVKVGGESTLPFLHFEGNVPNRPAMALEVWDMDPKDWPEILREPFSGVLDDPAAWAKKNVEYGADLVCLRFASANPEMNDSTPEQCAEVAKKVSEAVDVPLIIIGCGVEEKDAELVATVGEALSGKNYLFGLATENNYKRFAATAMVHEHNVIASAPLDINLSKQLNIMLTEMNLGADKIAIDPLVGALGYGLEYAYSIMERSRLGALMGDKMLSQPIISFVGQEAWKAKESTSSTDENPQWGEQQKRALMWEITTTTAFAQSGSSLFVLRHPESIKQLKVHFDQLMKSNEY